MPNRMNVMVLDVGQGNATFVEIYEDVGNPARETLVATILCDMGSEMGSKAAEASVRYIQGRLNAMDAPTINALFISHGDSDHHNYLVALTKTFKPARSTDGADARRVLTIGSVRYCGARSEYTLKSVRGGRPPGAPAKINTLTWLEKYLPAGAVATAFPLDASTFRGWDPANPAPAAFDTVRGVDLYVIAAGTVTVAELKSAKRNRDRTVKQSADAYAANTVSLVLLLAYQGAQFVVTGDATGLTVYECNTLVTADVSRVFMPNVQMLTLPHHGAMATGFGLTGPVGRQDPLAAGRARMTEFAGKVGARTVTASAERKKGFGHPDIRVIECFEGPLAAAALWQDPAAQNGRHYFTAWYEYACDFTRDPTGNRWPAAGGRSANWYTLQTAVNVYTNLYCVYRKEPWLAYPATGATNRLAVSDAPDKDDLPPLGQSWRYAVAAGGAVTLSPLENRANKTARSTVALEAAARVPAVVGAPASAGAARTVRLPGLKVVP